MSTNKTKKVKMATKSCPECDQQIPVACKSCPCGYVFISRKLLNAKLNERSPAIADKLDFKRRRTERIRRERIDPSLTNDMENKKRPRANSQSDPIRRGRGRPKTVGLKKQEEEKEKQEKEVDIYASLSDEKAFVFSVALAEINRKILGQRLILQSNTWEYEDLLLRNFQMERTTTKEMKKARDKLKPQRDKTLKSTGVDAVFSLSAP